MLPGAVGRLPGRGSHTARQRILPPAHQQWPLDQSQWITRISEPERTSDHSLPTSILQMRRLRLREGKGGTLSKGCIPRKPKSPPCFLSKHLGISTSRFPSSRLPLGNEIASFLGAWKDHRVDRGLRGPSQLFAQAVRTQLSPPFGARYGVRSFMAPAQ